MIVRPGMAADDEEEDEAAEAIAELSPCSGGTTFAAVLASASNCNCCASFATGVSAGETWRLLCETEVAEAGGGSGMHWQREDDEAGAEKRRPPLL